MKQPSVNAHQFAMIPAADVPRSSFSMQHDHKTTFDAGYLIPVYVDEILPGDTMRLEMSAVCRLATPLFPVMDNMRLTSFFFFVPIRILWDNFKKMMGEQANPADSISYTVPQSVSKASGYDINSVHDYFGLPTLGQLTAAATVSHNVLPLRAYNKIWNAWMRDENLQNSVAENQGDGPDLYTDYTLLRRGKRHDYFTSALPWPQKGTSVSLPLGTTAPVTSTGTNFTLYQGATPKVVQAGGAGNQYMVGATAWGTGGDLTYGPAATTTTGLQVNLAAATAATINQIRQAFQTQRLLERDARGGSRYTEIVRSHFRVTSPDARLQRPEYLGGSTMPVSFSEVEQTTQSGLTGGTTPLGTVGAQARINGSGHGFTQSFTEHGYIIGLIQVSADLTYQQGMRKMWSRSTRYDFYWPVFSQLGEQSVLNKEIYQKGDSDPNDAAVFGYQERHAEYRYHPSRVSSYFRSTAATTLDAWHLGQNFAALPTLNSTFIQDTPPVSRIVAVGAAANGKQFIGDFFFDVKAARPMPMYGVPGMIDHL